MFAEFNALISFLNIKQFVKWTLVRLFVKKKHESEITLTLAINANNAC